MNAPPPPEMPQSRWIVGQEGSRRTYSLPLAFHQLGILRLMYADIWCRYGRGLLRRGPAGPRALASRYHPKIPGNLVVSFSRQAIFRKAWLHLVGSKMSSRGLARHFCDFGEWYAGKIRRHLEALEIEPERDCFIGFNTNCLEAMDCLSARRVLTVIDQVDPGRVEEEIVLEENDRWPGWAQSDEPMPDFYWKRIQTEWKLADLIRVPSEWSQQALIRQGVPAEKLMIAPLAVEMAAGPPAGPIRAEGPLKVLWLGSLILRKGIAYLVEAAKKLAGRRIEFLLAGQLGISAAVAQTFPPSMKLLGRVTRDQLAQCYRQAHVFVFPTLSDGFGVTQLEAMAQGLPVITTPNCGQVVFHGLDGLIIPPRDSHALAEAIVRLDENRALLRELSANASQTVLKYKTPANGRALQNLVMEFRATQKNPAAGSKPAGR